MATYQVHMVLPEGARTLFAAAFHDYCNMFTYFYIYIYMYTYIYMYMFIYVYVYVPGILE